jgi:hypothetical protein
MTLNCAITSHAFAYPSAVADIYLLGQALKIPTGTWHGYAQPPTAPINPPHGMT